MEQLKTEFRMNDIDYKIIERSETRYFAELHSTESGLLIAYETGRILKGKASKQIIGGKEVNFKEKEHVIGNEAFGTDKDNEICMNPKSREFVYEAFKRGTEIDKNKKK